MAMIFTTLTLSDFLFFFNDTATTEIYTLSLHDALPICWWRGPRTSSSQRRHTNRTCWSWRVSSGWRSEEHTSELQSPYDLVCRLLLEKKKRLAVRSQLRLDGDQLVGAAGSGIHCTQQPL